MLYRFRGRVVSKEFHRISILTDNEGKYSFSVHDMSSINIGDIVDVFGGGFTGIYEVLKLQVFA